jgi:hypothetical protein
VYLCLLCDTDIPSIKDKLEIDSILEKILFYHYYQLLHFSVLSNCRSSTQGWWVGASIQEGFLTVDLAECAELPLKLWLAGSSTLLGIIPIGSRYRSRRSSPTADLKIRRP